MNLDDIEKLIDKKIKSHEVRVGWISGLIGALFTFGMIHSVWLLKILINEGKGIG